MNFGVGDANAGVLCYVDDALVKQVDETIAALDQLLRQLSGASCELSTQLGFGAWNAALNQYCSGAACPVVTEPNVFAFLQANVAFSQSLQRTLNR